MNRKNPVFWSLLVGLLLTCGSHAQSISEEMVRGYLWPSSPEEFRKSEESLRQWDERGLTRAEFSRLEQFLRAGAPAAGAGSGSIPRGRFPSTTDSGIPQWPDSFFLQSASRVFS